MNLSYESPRIEIVGESREHNRKTQLQQSALLPPYPPSSGLHRTKGKSGKLARCISSFSPKGKQRMEDLLNNITYTENYVCTSSVLLL